MFSEAGLLDAVGSGQRLANPESGKMKAKCSYRVKAGTQCVLFHARQFYSRLKGEEGGGEVVAFVLLSF
jgi:hypothetical protein